MSYHDCANCAWITDRLFGTNADIIALRKELERVDINANQREFIAKELHVQIARRAAYENTLEAHAAAYHIRRNDWTPLMPSDSKQVGE